jgi:DNA-binding PadR family transcriptional regulator
MHGRFGRAWAGDWDWFGPGFGPRRRRGPWRGGRGARRGDVRAAVLALLAERPMHGYEMIQELESRTGGLWRPSPGSIYPTLQLLEDEGLVTAEESQGRRLYTITDSGRSEVESRRAGPKPWEDVTEGADSGWWRLRDAVLHVGGAAFQVFRAGSDEDRNAALEILTEARRRLYTILAGTEEQR